MLLLTQSKYSHISARGELLLFSRPIETEGKSVYDNERQIDPIIMNVKKYERFIMNKRITVCVTLALLSVASIQGMYSGNSGSSSAGGYESSGRRDKIDSALREACGTLQYSRDAESAAEELFNRIANLGRLLTQDDWRRVTAPFFEALPDLISKWDNEPLAGQQFWAASGGSMHTATLYNHIGAEAHSNSFLMDFYRAVQEALLEQRDKIARNQSRSTAQRDGQATPARVYKDDNGSEGRSGKRNRHMRIVALGAAGLAVIGVLAYYMFGSSSKKGGRTVVYTK